MYIYIYTYIYIHTKDVETPAYTDTYMSARAQQPMIVEATWLLQCFKCARMSSDASNRCHRLSSISRHTSIALITLWADTFLFLQVQLHIPECERFHRNNSSTSNTKTIHTFPIKKFRNVACDISCDKMCHNPLRLFGHIVVWPDFSLKHYRRCVCHAALHTIQNLQESIILRETIRFKGILYKTSFCFPVLSRNMIVPAYVSPGIGNA